MLWRKRRRLLAWAQVVGSLGLLPTFALVVWSIGDVPYVLGRLGIVSPAPAVKWSDAGFVPVFLGMCMGIVRMYRLIYDLRERAITGDTDAIPPAKPLTAVNAAPLAVPITLVWTRAWPSRVALLIGFLLLLAAGIGGGALVVWAGLLSLVFPLQSSQFTMPTDAAERYMLLFGLAAIVSCEVIVALLAFACLRAATRGPQGVVADTFGVSAWRGHGARDLITWADARLLEVWGRHRKQSSALTYILYAADGRSLQWICRTDAPRVLSAHRLTQSDTNDSVERAAAIVALAATHAGLAPRTFTKAEVDYSSNLAAPGNVLSEDVVTGLGSGGFMLFLGLTAGCGVATLAYHSPLTPALSLVCATTLALSTLWSLILLIRDDLSVPRRLSPDERPAWRAPRALLEDRPAQLRQTRRRWRNWPTATRGALLLLGSVAGLAALISALLTGPSGGSRLVAAYSIVWLTGTLLVAALRVVGQFDDDRVRLVATAQGLEHGLTPARRPIPWADIVSLRFTWSRADGFLYTAETQRGDSFTWASQSPQWRDEPPDVATGVGATATDGDTFAAIVAARTGLAPAQSLLS